MAGEGPLNLSVDAATDMHRDRLVVSLLVITLQFLQDIILFGIWVIHMFLGCLDYLVFLVLDVVTVLDDFVVLGAQRVIFTSLYLFETLQWGIVVGGGCDSVFVLFVLLGFAGWRCSGYALYDSYFAVASVTGSLLLLFFGRCLPIVLIGITSITISFDNILIFISFTPTSLQIPPRSHSTALHLILNQQSVFLLLLVKYLWQSSIIFIIVLIAYLVCRRSWFIYFVNITMIVIIVIIVIIAMIAMIIIIMLAILLYLRHLWGNE